MENPREESIRIEMSYPPERKQVFERVKAGIEVKYPEVDVKGKETDRNGNEVMITLTYVPKLRNSAPPTDIDPDKKRYEATPSAAVHDFVSALIEEHSAEAHPE
ncbi:MAG: hypothetical protein ACOC3I_02010 [Verrucomicrobiota bacterium]